MNLDGYVPVTERLQAALAAHPELRVVELGHDTLDLGGENVLVCRVAVYRSPDDPLPAIGSASEHVPGRTPYTKGSELMVGYTSALGRALGYMGYGIAAGLASAEEVRAAMERRTDRPVEVGSKARQRPQERPEDIPPPRDPDEPPRPARRKEPTEKMAALYQKLVKERGHQPDPEALADFDACRTAIDHLMQSRD